jgi:hypothetical protein
MDLRAALRPLPLVLISLFVAVAVIDFVHTVRTTPEPPPSLFGDGAITIVELEPVIDLRPARTRYSDTLVPAVDMVGEQWSKPEKRGVWIVGDGAALDVAVTDGGHRVLVLDCTSARGRWSVATLDLEINGKHSGTLAIEEGWRRYRFPLPEDAIQPGVNRIVFSFPEPTPAATGRRRLLLRRCGLFLDGEVPVEAIERPPAVVVDPEAETVVFRASGSLEVPFTVDDRVDALQFRYRFTSENDRADIVIVRPQGAGAGRDAEFHRWLAADKRKSGRVRIPLHGRRGQFIFRFSADLGRRPARLSITALRLIKEGDPTRRRRADDPRPR